MLWEMMAPIPLIVSGIKFELGVMSLIYSAKTYKQHSDHEHEAHNHGHRHGIFCHDDDFDDSKKT